MKRTKHQSQQTQSLGVLEKVEQDPNFSPTCTHLDLTVILGLLPQDFLATFFTVTFSKMLLLKVILQSCTNDKNRSHRVHRYRIEEPIKGLDLDPIDDKTKSINPLKKI